MAMSLLRDRGAVLSDDGLHRYVLWRSLREAENPRRLVFIGMNPSTADAEKDDPTIRRCMGFARDHGFDRMYMLNLFTFRATNPDDLPTAWLLYSPAACGTRHREILAKYIGDADVVVAAWGAINHCHKSWAVCEVSAHAAAAGKILHCLGVTNSGDPRHPLYLPKSAPLIPWPGARA